MYQLDIKRSITDQFFDTPIGRPIRNAIYNDFTYVFKPGELFAIGYWKTNNIDIYYDSNSNKPKVRTNDIWFEDSLTFDVNLSKEDIRASVSHANHRYTLIDTFTNEAFKKEFNGVWATEIYKGGELYRRYEQNIRFVPGDGNINIDYFRNVDY